MVIKRKKSKVEPNVDGYCGFLVLDKNDRPYLANHWEKRFQYALGKYNRTFKEELPEITPHVCRHTYCTREMICSWFEARLMKLLYEESAVAFSDQEISQIRSMKEMSKKWKTAYLVSVGKATGISYTGRIILHITHKEVLHIIIIWMFWICLAT